MLTRRPQGEVKWPDGVRLVLALTFDFEAEEHHAHLSEDVPDYRDVYERQYAGRVGVWRALDVLAKHQVRSTFFICGGVVETYPDACLQIKASGHEVAGHTYHHEYLHQLTADQEHTVFRRMMAAFENLYGEPITGFRTCFPSHRTADFVAEYGFYFDSSCRDDDLPYILDRQDGRSYVEIPRGINGDAPLIGTPVAGLFNTSKFNPPSRVADHWKQEFDACYRRGETKTRLMTLCLHPYCIGRPSRAKALDDFLAHTRQFPGVWYATHGEIATWWRQSVSGSREPLYVPPTVAGP